MFWGNRKLEIFSCLLNKHQIGEKRPMLCVQSICDFFGLVPLRSFMPLCRNKLKFVYIIPRLLWSLKSHEIINNNLKVDIVDIKFENPEVDFVDRNFLDHEYWLCGLKPLLKLNVDFVDWNFQNVNSDFEEWNISEWILIL